MQASYYLEGHHPARCDPAGQHVRAPAGAARTPGYGLAGPWQRPGGRGPGRCGRVEAAQGLGGQTRPFGTVWKYVLLKTIFPMCQSALGFGGLGGWS